jgi:plasmid stability protein
MPVLSIRNLPDDVARALKRIAGERGQSVEKLVRDTLTALALPTLHARESEFWTRVRNGLKPGDVDAFDSARESIDDEVYQPMRLE